MRKDYVTTRYAQMGCRDGCRYCLPDTSETFREKDPRGYSYTVTRISPHCQKDEERTKYRAEIYARAEAASGAAWERCTTLRGKLKAMRREWRAVADEWTEGDCPFYEGLGPCPSCKQIDQGQTGEHSCPECGLPGIWDDPEKE